MSYPYNSFTPSPVKEGHNALEMSNEYGHSQYGNDRGRGYSNDAVSHWNSSFEQLADHFRDVVSGFKSASHQRGGVHNVDRYVSEGQSVLRGIPTLATMLQTMQREGVVGSGEADRRSKMLGQLARDARAFLAMCDEHGDSTVGSIEGGMHGGGGMAHDFMEDDGTSSLTNQQIREQRDAHIDAQDDALDNIVNHLGNLTDIAKDMNHELRYQSDILDNMENKMTGTDHKIKNTTVSVDDIREREGGGCCQLLIMLALLVLIIICAVSEAPCKIVCT